MRGHILEVRILVLGDNDSEADDAVAHLLNEAAARPHETGIADWAYRNWRDGVYCRPVDVPDNYLEIDEDALGLDDLRYLDEEPAP